MTENVNPNKTTVGLTSKLNHIPRYQVHHSIPQALKDLPAEAPIEESADHLRSGLQD